MAVYDWYLVWSGSDTKSLSEEEEFEAIQDVFTKKQWNKFLMVRVEEAAIKIKLEEAAATKVALSVMTK
eukprot:9034639-Ditylum_brightwellii.AAC.1